METIGEESRMEILERVIEDADLHGWSIREGLKDEDEYLRTQGMTLGMVSDTEIQAAIAAWEAWCNQ